MISRSWHVVCGSPVTLRRGGQESAGARRGRSPKKVVFKHQVVFLSPAISCPASLFTSGTAQETAALPDTEYSDQISRWCNAFGGVGTDRGFQIRTRLDRMFLGARTKIVSMSKLFEVVSQHLQILTSSTIFFALKPPGPKEICEAPGRLVEFRCV